MIHDYAKLYIILSNNTYLCSFFSEMEQVVGTPTHEEIMAMNQNYTDSRISQNPPQSSIHDSDRLFTIL